MMFLKSFPLVIYVLWVLLFIPWSNQANATTPLTRAEIQNLKNLVQLLPRNNKKRPARKLDPLNPGDGLATGRSSLADLRFNDGSLARIGERAVFQFLPQTRNFRLSNGTVLLLIPPGKGQTRIQTPSAAAAIRGSALFVRYDQQTDTTVVGALTDSGIEVFNREASQNQVLAAGQLMVIVKGQFQGLYDFDLRTFYETSDLVKGLNLTRQNLTPNPDPAIASVQAEIAAALTVQLPIVGQEVIENPSFLELSTNSLSGNNQSSIPDNSPVNSLIETGQFLPNTVSEPRNNDNIINPDQPRVIGNPSNPPGNNSSGGTTSGVTPPGLGGATPPGLGGATPPGLGGATPPGLGGATPPGTGGVTPPGLGGATPPGLGGATPPGLGGATPPGLGGATPPGLGGATPPGLGGATPPGLGGATPPGLGGTTPPGLGGTTPPGTDGVTPPGTDGTTLPGTDGVTPPGAGSYNHNHSDGGHKKP